MIPFEQDFFSAETRCDFLVDRTMKTCWAAEMELLYDVNVVCEKYDIPYYVYYGTLLGAVRHQGFVPWDDDIDIALLRGDYEKLMAVLPKELPSEYVIHNALADEDAEELWSSIANSDSISIEPARLKKFHGCPFVVGLDIYPLDFVPRDAEVREAVRKQFHFVWTTRRLAKRENRTAEEEENLQLFLREIERQFQMKFDRSRPIISQLVRLANRIAASVREEDGDELSVYINVLGRPKEYAKKSCFEKIDWAPFENIFVPIPHGYDEILTALYGDYKTPVMKRQSHDYPFYNRQLEWLRQKADGAHSRYPSIDPGTP